ncbi:MAG: MBL fold metallo-hydrolase [Bacteroidetes bacterium]|nr:MAG: MBL fold metallo-hydrolase [Bacteroidota bacterium]
MIKILDLNFLGHSKTIASFLLESTAGPILFETGPASTLPVLEKRLRENGYEIKDIRHVFISHVHLDHAGAAWAFARNGSIIYMHPAGERHMTHPEKLYNSDKRIYQDDMDRLWGELHPVPVQNIWRVPHKEKVRIGQFKIKGWHTPGHAFHHISWQVNNVLIAGDVAGVKIDDGIVLPPCPPPDINIEQWLDSIRLIRSRRFDALYLTHFGEVTDVKNHLIELKGRLLNWATWIKPFFDAGKSAEEIIPLFQEYVRKQLSAAGIEGESLERYESANPSWMSVAGLLRYWKKKTEAESSAP